MAVRVLGGSMSMQLSWAVPVPPLQALLLLLAVQRSGCLLPCAVGIWALEPALHRRFQEEDHPAGGDRCCEVGAGPAAMVGLTQSMPGFSTGHPGVFSGTGMTHVSSR